jgi:hypothetical protein
MREQRRGTGDKRTVETPAVDLLHVHPVSS